MPSASIKSGDSTLAFDSINGALTPTVGIAVDGELHTVLDGAEFLTLVVGDVSSAVKVTQVAGSGMPVFRGEFPGLPDWSVQGQVEAIGDLAPRFEWRVRLVYKGDEPVEFRAHVKFRVRDTGVPRWMIPGMFYEHNRPENCTRKYPKYAFGQNDSAEMVSSYWAFRSDRSACPSVFCWTDNFTSCVSTQAMLGDETSGLAFRGDESGTYVMLNFPYVEEPIKYSFCYPDGTAPQATTGVAFGGTQIDLKFSTYVEERNLHAYDDLVRDLYNDAEDETNPWVTKDEADALVAYGLYTWFYDPEHRALYETCAFDSYFAKHGMQVDRPHMHVSWVGGIPYAYALWKYGQTHSVKQYVDAGISVIDKAADEGLSPSGLFYSQWTLESGWGTGWNPKPEWLHSRTTGEATWFLLQAMEYAKQTGAPRDNWAAAVTSNLDVAVRTQRSDGNFGTYYNVNTGAVEEWDGAGGLMWVPALLAGEKYFGNVQYRSAAIRAGEYYSQFVANEYIYGAPEDVHLCPSSEDAYNAVIAYTHLYEATEDGKWLDLACSAADLMATFRWMYNTRFADTTILGKYDYRTLGGDSASPANHHLHNYGLICHPELLRLWQYTGDTYYLSRAADHLACSHQFIARDEADFGARKGMITEQWYHTDWTHPKGGMLQLAHCWCAGLILYANVFTREFGDIVIDADSREVFVVDSPWIKSSEDADPDLILTLVNPTAKSLSLSVRHSKHGRIGSIELNPDSETRVLIGGIEPKVELLADEEDLWS